MHESEFKLELWKWQRDFVEDFLEQPSRKSLLVAAPGTGKTGASLSAAKRMLQGKVDRDDLESWIQRTLFGH